MDEINFFPENLEIKDLKVILRLDLNVPIKNKIITDDTRITLCLPFINKLIEKKAKIIIISHLGRPKGINIPELSLIPVYKFLKDKLKTNVYFFRGNFNSETNEKFSHLKGGEVILIENIRFFKEETEDDEGFAKKLGSLGDIYINDAFSCSHRMQASVHNITKFVKKSYAGPLFKREITAINLVIKNKKEPVTCIIGGSKISTKINVITNLITKVNNLIIVGAMANNFFLYKNLKIGKSLIEETKLLISLVLFFNTLQMSLINDQVLLHKSCTYFVISPSHNAFHNFLNSSHVPSATAFINSHKLYALPQVALSAILSDSLAHSFNKL